jgi:hypothetical protein
MRTQSFTFLIILFTINASSLSAQQTDSAGFKWRNNVQVWVGGHGLIYSFNYERLLLNRTKFKTVVNAGVAYYPETTGIMTLWFPVTVSEILSFNKHHLELGIGNVTTTSPVRRNFEGDPAWRDWEYFPCVKLGYRFQKPQGRFLYQIAFTPVIEWTKTFKEIYPLAGGSVGYSF